MFTDKPSLHSEPSETENASRLSLLKQQLDERLALPRTSGWRILPLEWRYDFALLFDQARGWITYIDRSYNTRSN
ncbi:MAG TPA: hypothetical protein VL202_23570 [Pararhizobium sp.]|uniref:hypothetical protein n=1 Tax=Pararhizobium sp. TaxID=1977563 RepID=UPI002D04BFDE|nr:hypothetical protein [Pararhizobium sp.]HTO34126.1 hypothetical protein [Pararhizobium sp.]